MALGASAMTLFEDSVRHRLICATNPAFSTARQALCLFNAAEQLLELILGCVAPRLVQCPDIRVHYFSGKQGCLFLQLALLPLSGADLHFYRNERRAVIESSPYAGESRRVT